MAYVISTFDDRYQADAVQDNLKQVGLQDVDYAVTDRSDTVKGWFQRLFGLGDDASKLQSKGVPPEEAQYYDNELERGCVLLVARTDVAAPRVSQVLRERGARDVRVYAERAGTWERVSDADLSSDRWEKMYGYEPYVPLGQPPLGPPTVREADAGVTAATAGTPRPDVSTEEQRIPVREEELRTGKRERQAGEVTVSKDVVEEPVHREVPVTRERVRVERKPLGDVMAGRMQPIKEGETIRIPVTEEEVVVEKRPMAKEEVVITKERETYTQPVDEKVRKEQVRVEGDNDRVRNVGGDEES